ncbi:hypothetical protein JKF63_04672 [Porcisia hertigi]|uniref:Uncharacterized protein n=1 Tax=Porcisia hertigi TaxID=2761500 RepID=A0A836IPX9_9TRYP|nr:hypothetical protein JKF63_04672 [Porcisia hertigi]
MPPKAASGKKSSAKKAKPVFDAFERFGQYTSVPVHDAPGSPHTASNAGSQPATKVNMPLPTAVLVDGAGAGENGVHAAEFAASALTITPPLPRTEVSLLVQFRVSVALSEGDIIYIHLTKFRGPVAQQFALERVSSTTALGGNAGGHAAEQSGFINTSTHFRAYWSGDSAHVTTPVHQLAFKRGKHSGVPPKQVLLLQCIKAINPNTHLLFRVPRALGLVSPDTMPANRSKVKIEGPLIREASGKRILKQVFLTSTEIKKRTVVEELEIYDHCISQIAQDGRVPTEDRHLTQQLSLEELDQLWQAAQYRRRYPLPMPWSISDELFIPYDAAGSFVKRIIQNALKQTKDFDPLAVHREVARNWGVKVAAVIVLDDLLTTQWGGLYPGLPRTSLLASCLLTMEPEDVGRTFPRLLTLPERSIADDLVSAFRMRKTLLDSTATAARSVAPANGKDMEMELVGGLPDRCGAFLNKWAALLTALLPASLVAEQGCRESKPVRSAPGTAAKQKTAAIAELHGAMQLAADRKEGAAAAASEMAADCSPRVDFQLPVPDEEDDQAHDGDSADDPATAYTRYRKRHSSAASCGGSGLDAIARLKPPPTLYIGYRDIPFDVQRSLREIQRGDWFVLPFIVVARQSLPYASNTKLSPEDSATLNEDDDAHATAATEGDEVSDGPIVAIPDNAVVVELQNVVEALELADLSFSPHNRAWLLPLVTSCRVISVKEDQHDVLHVILDVRGSLVGQVDDSCLPQSDRTVSRTILSKYLLKCEQTETYVSSLSFLSLLFARRNDRRRLHPPTLIRAQYISHCNASLYAAIAKHHVEESESVEWQMRTHDAQLLDEGVVKPAVWEPIPKKYVLNVEQFFLGHSRTTTRLEEGTLIVDLEAYTIDYGGKGPRALRRVVQKTYVTHEPPCKETYAILRDREEQYAKQISALDTKLGISTNTTAGANGGGGAAAAGGTSASDSNKKALKK